ncbi:hypothetical protein [Nesterenkonia haasae]|uniref:hypothetical protein n=1 Tax=Nesterenkonia haasae TaxID=2587813 RepID=UPI001391C5F7|nr:hypothetical protein [Nesterenkonia haasae]NDK31765.1 hypothetical protein [Nesterenkonia haasae]
MPSETQRRKVSVRTAPKLLPFLVGAVLAAFTTAVIVVYNTPEDPNYSRVASLGYITLVLCLPALTLAGTAWLLLDKALRRRSTTYDIKPAGER